MTEEIVRQIVESLLPHHTANLIMKHNPHKAVYQPLAQYIEDEGLGCAFSAPEEKAKSIAADELWELRWYPDTPVGFCIRCSSTLWGLLQK